MPRLTPIHYKEFEKFLLHIGCRFIRQKGDHRIYNKPGLKRPIVIPAIKDIPIFIIRNNLRVLDISVEEYLIKLSSI
jgi:predicted RNA binding protein YcfA (HicA-like mRNA interferase family)